MDPEINVKQLFAQCVKVTDLVIPVDQTKNLRWIPAGLRKVLVFGESQSVGEWVELLGERGPRSLRTLQKLVVNDRSLHSAGDIAMMRELCAKRKIELELGWRDGKLGAERFDLEKINQLRKMFERM